jgi:mercuric ion transport protein
MQPRRKQSALGWTAFAVVASLVASTCCVLPLVLVLIGVTGAWMVNLAALKPWTPAFIVLALAALGWAAFLVFGKQTQCSPLDGVCQTTQPFVRRVFVACAIFISMLLLFPLAAPLFY